MAKNTKRSSHVYGLELAPSDCRLMLVSDAHKKNIRKPAAKNKSYHSIKATYILEHTPDIIRWFEEVSISLQPGGLLTLVISDKRYSFDIDRRSTTPADVAGAYCDHLVSPSSAMTYEYFRNIRPGINAQDVWDGDTYLTSHAPREHSAIGALELSQIRGSQETDIHCHSFTPGSFFAVAAELMELGLFAFEVKEFADTKPGQSSFTVILKKSDPASSTARKIQSIPNIEGSQARELRATAAAQAALIETLQSDLAAAKKEINHMIGSQSWRLTRPMRYALRRANKLKRQP